MANPRYSEQFKREAVRLVTVEGYSPKKTGEAVGVCHTTIHNWGTLYGDEAPQRTKLASELDELEHLRTENRRLRMERDILKDNILNLSHI